MTSSKYGDFLRGCSPVSNCTIICKNGHKILSHKIVLAVCGDFLKILIQDIPVADNVTVFMPDYWAEEIEQFIENRLMKEPSACNSLESIFSAKKDFSPEQMLQVKLEEENKRTLPQQKRKRDTSYDEDFYVDYSYHDRGDKVDDDDDDFGEISKDFPKKSKKLKAKASVTPSRKSEYKPRNVDFEKLNQKLISHPQTREDVKHNEIIEKQILHEKAIEAYLSGDASLNEIGKQFGVKKSTICKLLKCDKKFSGRGNKSHLFTEEEEKTVTEKALAWINSGGQMNLNSLRELLTEEINLLKMSQPERQFSLSAKDGAVINKSYVRRFAIRNKLERFMFQKYTLSEKRKFECDICNKSFTLKCSLVTHQKQIHFSFLHNSDANNTF